MVSEYHKSEKSKKEKIFLIAPGKGNQIDPKSVEWGWD